jgi:hypothetical protein
VLTTAAGLGIRAGLRLWEDDLPVDVARHLGSIEAELVVDRATNPLSLAW